VYRWPPVGYQSETEGGSKYQSNYFILVRLMVELTREACKYIGQAQNHVEVAATVDGNMEDVVTPEDGDGVVVADIFIHEGPSMVLVWARWPHEEGAITPIALEAWVYDKG
jgi:hypothetical protein